MYKRFKDDEGKYYWKDVDEVVKPVKKKKTKVEKEKEEIENIVSKVDKK